MICHGTSNNPIHRIMLDTLLKWLYNTTLLYSCIRFANAVIIVTHRS